MRILRVTGGFPPSVREGGTATAALGLVRGLIELGHNVSVFTTDADGRGGSLDRRGWCEYQGVPVFYGHRINCGLPYLSIDLIGEFAREVPGADAVLIDSAWTCYGPAVALLSHREEVPFFMYAHGSFAPARLAMSRIRKWMWWRLIDRPMYSAASAAIALTESERLHMKAVGVDVPIEVVPNGIETPPELPRGSADAFRQRIGVKLDAFLVMYLGRVHPIKGIGRLLKAFGQIREALRGGRPWRCVVIGPDERGEKANLKRLSARLGLGQCVQFLGPLSAEQKWEAYAAADLLVLPSLGEGMPMVALEALAVGLTVVASRECYLSDSGLSTAVLTFDGTIHGLSRVILSQYHRARESKSDMSRQAGAALSEYSWKGIAARTVEVVRRYGRHCGPI